EEGVTYRLEIWQEEINVGTGTIPGLMSIRGMVPVPTLISSCQISSLYVTPSSSFWLVVKFVVSGVCGRCSAAGP
ncbi:MAG: hypothetical protein ACLPX8_09085, partial [Bryobacteraceae bacterium]